MWLLSVDGNQNRTQAIQSAMLLCLVFAETAGRHHWVRPVGLLGSRSKILGTLLRLATWMVRV